MKKYFGPVFLIASVIIAITLIRNKPTAEIKEVEKNIPFVKTMILKSQNPPLPLQLDQQTMTP